MSGDGLYKGGHRPGASPVPPGPPPHAASGGSGETTKTLRDEFAMAALSGLLAYPGDGGCAKGRIASACYEYADAMVKARQS